jgi:signal transduction histidine kinase
VTTSIVPVALNATTEQTLLRIAQEALSNAARHANASLIALSLAPQERTVCLVVMDNGRGMELDESSATHGLGLRLMQERVVPLSDALEES